MLRYAIGLVFLLMVSGCSSYNVYKGEENAYGQNDLMRAVFYQDVERFDQDLNHSSMLHDTDRTGANILHYIARYGTKEMAEKVLKAGGDDVLQQKESIRGTTPLQEAFYTGNIEVAKLLYHVPEINVHQLDGEGRSLLHLALLNGQNEMAMDLLAKGLQPNLQDEDGNTPYHLYLSCLEENRCSGGMSIVLIREMLKFGMDAEIKNEDGESIQQILDDASRYDLFGKGPHTNLNTNAFILKMELKRNK